MRRSHALVLTLLAAMSFSACGGGDDDDDGAPRFDGIARIGELDGNSGVTRPRSDKPARRRAGSRVNA